MLYHSKLALAALVAAAFLALAVGDASAGRLSVNERNFELIWDNALPGKTKYEIIIPTLGINIQCKLTLLGRFNSNTIVKSPGINEATINHSVLNECEGGSATLRSETLPWNIRYRSFAGTLPRITRLTLGVLGARYRLREPNGFECEYSTEASHPGSTILESGLETTGEPENATLDRNSRIPLRGLFLCEIPGEAEWGGIGLIRNLPRTGFLRFTLI